MQCPSCGSRNQGEFSTEMNFHFPFRRLDNLHSPAVLIFPKMFVCLDCGFARCSIAEPELQQLRGGTAWSAAG
jgi:hypothetical protein